MTHNDTVSTAGLSDWQEKSPLHQLGNLLQLGFFMVCNASALVIAFQAF